MDTCLSIFLLLIGSSSAAHYTYDAQDQWPGFCSSNTGRQSPINILTERVEFGSSLIDLELTGWEEEYEGVFTNTGITTSFTANMEGQVTTRNHLGTYQLLNCHFHWGNRTGTGAEHTIDGDSGKLEVHFVHRKMGEAKGSTAGDAIAVIAVIANVDSNAKIEGPWAELNATAIQGVNETTPTAFRFDQFLPPANREYYFYEGSLTAPNCDETVMWFVMREPITVPGQYLEALRNVTGSEGPTEGNRNRPLTYNYREVQPLNNRVVMTNSQAITKPVLAILTLCLLLVVAALS